MHTGNYYVLEVSGSGTKTPSNDMTIGGLCTITSGTMDLGSGNLVTLNGGIGGTSGILIGSCVSELAIGANITLPSSLFSLKFLYLNAGTAVLSNSLNIAAATGSLVLNGGMVSTASFINVNNTSATSVSGGSTTSYINGPLKRSLALGSNVGSWVYPVGAGGRYLPFTLIDPVCVTAAQTYSIEAFSSNCGGSNGTCAASISSTEYWKGTLFSGSGNISSASVSLGRNTALGTLNAIGRATTSSASGVYNSYKGTVSGTNINISDNVGALNFGSPAYFAMIVQGTDTPTLTTPTSTVLTLNTAVLGGSITSVGCSDVTTRGVYYSTTNGFPNGTGTCFSVTAGPYTTGSFTIPVTGLMPSTTYYYVAFATNANGTSYSPQGTFTVRTPVKYYVNDTYSASDDIYTTATGTNSASCGTASNTPVLTLTYMLSQYSASFNYGDTIFIDSGSYSDKDLSSPVGGVVIKGAGTTRTIFTNPGNDNYFMIIDDNNTNILDMKLVDFDDISSLKAQTICVETNITGVNLIALQLDKGTPSSSGSNRPIVIKSGASVYISGGGTTCNTSNYGGGIHITGAATTVTITNFSNIGNYRNAEVGVALYIASGNVLITNSLFQENSSDGTNTGSAVYIADGEVNIIDCFFNSNKNINNSGGNNVGGTLLIGGGNVRIARSKIWGHAQGGSSTSYGAGIANTSGTLILDSCWFKTNTGSTTRGTDAYNDGGTINARHCIFGSTSIQIGVASGVASSFSIANCGSPGIYTGSGSVSQINNTSPTYSANPTVPAFSGTCSTAITILPIELTRFSGDCNNGNVILNWQTATEKNNQIFNIQRSSDGIVFETISSIAGAGNSEQLRNYTFVDEDDIDGLSYYRLSQTDYDGTESQSNIIVVDHVCGEKEDTELDVYPNPSQHNFTLDVKLFKKAEMSVEIVNALGQLVKKIDNRKYDIGIQSIDINVSDLSTGIYYLNVLVDDKPYVKKLIKL